MAKMEIDGKAYEFVRYGTPRPGELFIGADGYVNTTHRDTVVMDRLAVVRDIPPAVPHLPPIPDGWRLLEDSEVMDGTEMRCDGVDRRLDWIGSNEDSDGLTVREFYEKYPTLKILAVIGKTYAKLQAEWVEKVGLKVGDKVKVLREFTPGECGAGAGALICNDIMRRYVGSVERVNSITEGAIAAGSWYWPYFVLEKVVVKTRAMNREEFLKAWKSRGWCPLVGASSGNLYCVSCVKEDSVGLNGGHWVGFTNTSCTTLRDYLFASDNSPCTVESVE